VRSPIQPLASSDPSTEGPAELGPGSPSVNANQERTEHYIMVWRLLRRLGVLDSNADDATQQVFLIATERQAQIEPGKERAFLYGTALRVARIFLRRARRPLLSIDENAFALDDATAIEELLDRHSARQILDQLLDQMPFDIRAVFVLFEIEELSVGEIAQTLDIPRGTAASRLRRAREDFEARVARLHARLSRRGGQR
jgi:RNA polymerase sigma-70 factor, ECF subfamily